MSIREMTASTIGRQHFGYTSYFLEGIVIVRCEVLGLRGLFLFFLPIPSKNEPFRLFYKW